MHTGESEPGLKKILDFTRLASIAVLLVHIYYYCYGAFAVWGYTTTITDRLLLHLKDTGLFASFHLSKTTALVLLAISLLGSQGKKSEKLNGYKVLGNISAGFILYYGSVFLLYIHLTAAGRTLVYALVTALGYAFILRGGTLLSRLIRLRFSHDIFNTLNETFPQEERLLKNEYSINLPGRYNLKGKIRKSWINIINPFRSFLVIGSPGSGKSWFVIQHVIRQHIEKGFALFVYDFKYDDLTRIAYNHLQKHLEAYQVKPSFYVINFDDLSYSNRCNPLDPSTMYDITDATESSRTIMLGLNREWIKKQGDFFVESPINFVTAVIWFLKKFENGKYCTLPHVIELMQVEYSKLFPVLRS